MDETALSRVAETHRLVVTMEEANLRGGFGQAVAHWMMEHRASAHVHCIGIEDCFVTHGARNILLDWAGLSAQRVEKRILQWLESPPLGTNRIRNSEFGIRNSE